MDLREEVGICNRERFLTMAVAPPMAGAPLLRLRLLPNTATTHRVGSAVAASRGLRGRGGGGGDGG